METFRRMTGQGGVHNDGLVRQHGRGPEVVFESGVGGKAREAGWVRCCGFGPEVVAGRGGGRDRCGWAHGTKKCLSVRPRIGRPAGTDMRGHVTGVGMRLSAAVVLAS